MPDAERDACRIVEVDGESVRVVGGADDWTQGDHEAFAEVVRAAKRKFHGCTCSPYFGCSEYAPDCPTHGTSVLPPATTEEPPRVTQPERRQGGRGRR